MCMHGVCSLKLMLHHCMHRQFNGATGGKNSRERLGRRRSNQETYWRVTYIACSTCIVMSESSATTCTCMHHGVRLCKIEAVSII